MVAVTAVMAVAVAARAHAVTVVETAAGMVAAKAAVPTAAVNSSPHVRKAPALPRAKAVAVVPAWANNRLALPTNPAHRAHPPVSLTRCAPASI